MEKYECYKTDLYSSDNLKFLFEKKDNKVCQYPLSRLINDISVSELDVYINSGGNLDYVSYLGNFIHHLVNNVNSEVDINVFVEKLKRLNVNGEINQKMENDDADPGYTPLDTFIKKTAETCEDANSRYFSSGYLVKDCNAYKVIYSKLKNFGAKCNRECSDEHYLK